MKICLVIIRETVQADKVGNSAQPEPCLNGSNPWPGTGVTPGGGVPKP